MSYTTEDLDHFEALAFAATPGPWDTDPLEIGTPFNIETQEGVSVAMAAPIPGDRNHEQRQANADFIAGLNPEIVLALVSQLRGLMKS